MTEQEAAKLSDIFRKADGRLAWFPDDDVGYIRVVKSIAGHVAEDGKCAFFAGGEYAALYNCPIDDFVILKRLS